MLKKSIKIAQISDSHLLKDPDENIQGVNPYQRLSRVLNHIKESHYDLILFTGDVANNCAENSYEQLLELTSDINDKIVIIPGNHDDLDILKKVLSKSKIFIIAPKEPVTINNWSFVYLNTVVKSENHGYLSDDDLRNLALNLEKTGDSNVCILMHHHLFDIGLSFVDKYKIQNSEKIYNVITPNVKLVVNGHVHNDYTIVKDILYTCCPSTAFQFTKNMKVDNGLYGFKEYVLSNEQIFWHSTWFTNHSLLKG